MPLSENPTRSEAPDQAVVLCHGPTAGLNVVRALKRHGIRSIAISFDDNVVLSSRIPKHKIHIPGDDLAKKDACLLYTLRTMILPGRPPLLATSDHLLDFLCKHRTELEAKFSLLLPESDVVMALNDKASETELVARLGFAIPRTVAPLPASMGELEEQISFPMMIKLRKHDFWSVLGRKNLIIRGHDELRRFYSERSRFTRQLIAQDLIEGTDDASWICSAVFNRSHELIGAAMKRKLRMAPAHYGDGSIAVSEENPELVALVGQLGRELRLAGIAGFEFRWDERDRQYKYIEINPRFGSGCSSAEYDDALGVPTALLTHRLALDRPVSPVNRQRNNILYREFDKDLLARLHENESFVGVLLDHVRLSWRGAVHNQYASFADPVPHLKVWARTARRLLRRTPKAANATLPDAFPQESLSASLPR